MIKPILALAVAGAALALAACASQPKSQSPEQTAKQDQSHMVCVSHMPVGSHIAKTQCMTTTEYHAYKKAQEKQQKSDRQALKNAQQYGGQAIKCTGSC